MFKITVKDGKRRALVDLARHLSLAARSPLSRRHPCLDNLQHQRAHSGPSVSQVNQRNRQRNHSSSKVPAGLVHLGSLRRRSHPLLAAVPPDSGRLVNSRTQLSLPKELAYLVASVRTTRSNSSSQLKAPRMYLAVSVTTAITSRSHLVLSVSSS